MKVLLVEDDASLREGMGELIAEQSEVRETGSVAQALGALREELFSLVVTDLRIGDTGEGGRIILEAARKRLQPVAIVSAATAEEVGKVLRPHEPDVVLAKPFQIDDILGMVERFVGLRQQVVRAAERGPPQGTWTEVAAGVRTLEEPDGLLWVRMEPGMMPAQMEPRPESLIPRVMTRPTPRAMRRLYMAPVYPSVCRTSIFRCVRAGIAVYVRLFQPQGALCRNW